MTWEPFWSNFLLGILHSILYILIPKVNILLDAFIQNICMCLVAFVKKVGMETKQTPFSAAPWALIKSCFQGLYARRTSGASLACTQ